MFNGTATLEACLQALTDSCYQPSEVIVVDDGSSDGSAAIARRYGATVLSSGGRYGPARARNIGAQMASGEVLIFIDADVAVHADTLGRIAGRFENDADLDALIGSYDDRPADAGFVSKFKNLMHAFVHRQGNHRASTFWCGCGAVRRTVYLDHGGLDETYLRPSIEDIELGYRMAAAGRKLELDPLVQCQHLKRWTLRSLIRTDVFQRGIPWTQLIVRTGVMPNDLNVSSGQRISVALAGLLVVFAVTGMWPLSLLSLALLCGINRAFMAFLASREGWLFALKAVPLHLLYFLYSGFSFIAGLILHLWRQPLRTPPPVESEPEC